MTKYNVYGKATISAKVSVFAEDESAALAEAEGQLNSIDKFLLDGKGVVFDIENDIEYDQAEVCR